MNISKKIILLLMTVTSLLLAVGCVPTKKLKLQSETYLIRTEQKEESEKVKFILNFKTYDLGKKNYYAEVLEKEKDSNGKHKLIFSTLNKKDYVEYKEETKENKTFLNVKVTLKEVKFEKEYVVKVLRKLSNGSIITYYEGNKKFEKPIGYEKENPIHIKTKEEFLNIKNDYIKNESFSRFHYVLDNDIDLEGQDIPTIFFSKIKEESYSLSEENLVLRGFFGTFNGNGKTIRNVSIKKIVEKPNEQSYYSLYHEGIFGRLNDGAKVFDLNIEKVTVDNTNFEPIYHLNFGIISGKTYSGSTIENINIKDVDYKVYVKNRDYLTYAGVVAGYNLGNIKNVNLENVSATLTRKTKRNQNELLDSVYRVNLIFGGISAYNGGVINKVSTIGNLSIKVPQQTYGLYNSRGRISDSTGDYRKYALLGGIVGESLGVISEAFVKGNIKIETESVIENEIDLNQIVVQGAKGSLYRFYVRPDKTLELENNSQILKKYSFSARLEVKKGEDFYFIVDPNSGDGQKLKKILVNGVQVELKDETSGDFLDPNNVFPNETKYYVVKNLNEPLLIQLFYSSLEDNADVEIELGNKKLENCQLVGGQTKFKVGDTVKVKFELKSLNIYSQFDGWNFWKIAKRLVVDGMNMEFTPTPSLEAGKYEASFQIFSNKPTIKIQYDSIFVMAAGGIAGSGTVIEKAYFDGKIQNNIKNSKSGYLELYSGGIIGVATSKKENIKDVYVNNLDINTSDTTINLQYQSYEKHIFTDVLGKYFEDNSLKSITETLIGDAAITENGVAKSHGIIKNPTFDVETISSEYLKELINKNK